MISDIKIDKNRLLDSFSKYKSFSNLKVLKCYKVLFNKNGILKNIGCYTITPIILFHFICVIIFYLKDSKIIKCQINEIIYIKKNIKKKKVKVEIKKGNNKSKMIKEKSKTEIIKKKEGNNKKEKINSPIKKRTKRRNKSQSIKINLLKTSDDITNKEPTKLKLIKSENNLLKSGDSLINKNNDMNKIEEKIKINKSIMRFNDYELNILPYNQAIKYDKRSFSKFYLSLLKTRHILMFSFCPSKDYNSRIIKIYLFFYSFAIYLTVNALFFDDNTINKIYEVLKNI